MSLRISILPIDHTELDLRERDSTPCCAFYMSTDHLQFPRKGWVDLVPTVVEMLANTAELFGSVVEFEVSFMRGPFSLVARRDLRQTRFSSAFDARAQVTIAMKANGRTVRNGRVTVPLRHFAKRLHGATSTFLRRIQTPGSPAVEALRAAWVGLARRADIERGHAL